MMKERSTTHGVTISSLKDDLTTGAGAPLVLMFVAVGFILLIGCANVANLLLARAAGRNREVALRIAMGAGRWRIVRQLITESTLLSLLGAGLGLVVGWWTIAGLVTTLGPRLPRAGEIRMDAAVLLFTLGVAVITGILFGLAPARTLLRGSLTDHLAKEAAAGRGGKAAAEHSGNRGGCACTGVDGRGGTRAAQLFKSDECAERIRC